MTSIRQTRKRSPQAYTEDSQQELQVEETQATTQFEDSRRGQAKKKVQKQTKSKKTAQQDDESPTQSEITTMDTQKSKLGPKKSAAEHIDDASDSKKDSWGDTIFNEKEPSPKPLEKTSVTKRKADKITADTIDAAPLKLSKKIKQTKELPSEEIIELAPKSVKKKFANGLLERRPLDLIRQIKYIATLDIVLSNIDIPITRQISISTEVTFARLARIIVACMGWKGYHDWKFLINGDEIYTPDIDSEDGSRILANEVFLDQYSLEKGQIFEFTYNMSCGWKHMIKITEVREMQTEKQCERGKVTFNPVLVAGKNACPPDEMSGGAKEYNMMLKVLASRTPKTTYEEYVECYGNDYNSYEFKPIMVNNLLKNFPYDEFFDTTKGEHDSIFRW